MNRICFIVMITMASLLVVSCGGRIRSGLGSRGLSGQERIPCQLKIVNHEPFKIIANIDGGEYPIMAHDSLTITVKAPAEYRIRRENFLLGYKWDDLYRDVIPRKCSYTIVFGGPQYGYIINVSGMEARVAPQGGKFTNWIPQGGKSALVAVMPGEVKFYVEFKNGRAVTVTADGPAINRRHKDVLSDGEWVDWTQDIRPQDLRRSKRPR